MMSRRSQSNRSNNKKQPPQCFISQVIRPQNMQATSEFENIEAPYGQLNKYISLRFPHLKHVSHALSSMLSPSVAREYHGLEYHKKLQVLLSCLLALNLRPRNEEANRHPLTAEFLEQKVRYLGFLADCLDTQHPIPEESLLMAYDPEPMEISGQKFGEALSILNERIEKVKKQKREKEILQYNIEKHSSPAVRENKREASFKPPLRREVEPEQEVLDQVNRSGMEQLVEKYRTPDLKNMTKVVPVAEEPSPKNKVVDSVAMSPFRQTKLEHENNDQVRQQQRQSVWTAILALFLIILLTWVPFLSAGKSSK